jgi:hypothetical protein
MCKGITYLSSENPSRDKSASADRLRRCSLL